MAHDTVHWSVADTCGARHRYTGQWQIPAAHETVHWSVAAGPIVKQTSETIAKHTTDSSSNFYALKMQEHTSSRLNFPDTAYVAKLL